MEHGRYDWSPRVNSNLKGTSFVRSFTNIKSKSDHERRAPTQKLANSKWKHIFALCSFDGKVFLFVHGPLVAYCICMVWIRWNQTIRQFMNYGALDSILIFRKKKRSSILCHLYANLLYTERFSGVRSPPNLRAQTCQALYWLLASDGDRYEIIRNLRVVFKCPDKLAWYGWRMRAEM